MTIESDISRSKTVLKGVLHETILFWHLSLLPLIYDKMHAKKYNLVYVLLFLFVILLLFYYYSKGASKGPDQCVTVNKQLLYKSLLF